MQVTTVTQLVREVQHIGPDGQPVLVDPYSPYGEYAGQPTYGRNGSSSSVGVAGQPARFANYEHIADGTDYRTHSPYADAAQAAAAAYGRTTYADYEPYPHLAGGRGVVVPPDYAYQTAQPPGIYRDYPDMDPGGTPGTMAGAVPIYGERPPTPPSPSEQSESPLPHHSRGAFLSRVVLVSPEETCHAPLCVAISRAKWEAKEVNSKQRSGGCRRQKRNEPLCHLGS